MISFCLQNLIKLIDIFYQKNILHRVYYPGIDEGGIVWNLNSKDFFCFPCAFRCFFLII